MKKTEAIEATRVMCRTRNLLIRSQSEQKRDVTTEASPSGRLAAIRDRLAKANSNALYDHAPADIAFLLAEVERLAAVILSAVETLKAPNPAIADTIWYSPGCTLVDHLEAAARP